jgi:hypothetical protein
MATTFTPRLNYGKPAIGDADWGTTLNQGMDDADERLFQQSSDNAYTPLIETEVFSGTGLDDASSGGTMAGARDLDIVVQIDSVGTPDTFRWSKDGGATYEATGVVITGSAQALVDGVTVAFVATSTHTLWDKWTFAAKAGDPQDPNDIDGVGTPLTAHYVGQRYYAELDEIWWLATTTTSWMLEDLLVQAVASHDKNRKNIVIDPDTGIISSGGQRIYTNPVQPPNFLLNGFSQTDAMQYVSPASPLPDIGDEWMMHNADFWVHAHNGGAGTALEAAGRMDVSSLPAGLLPIPAVITDSVHFMEVAVADTKFVAYHLVTFEQYKAMAQYGHVSLRLWLAADNAGSAATLTRARVGLLDKNTRGVTPWSTWGAQGVNPTKTATTEWVYQPAAHVTIPSLDWVEVYIPNIEITTPSTNENLMVAVWADIGSGGSSAIGDKLYILGAVLAPENSARQVQAAPYLPDLQRMIDQHIFMFDTVTDDLFLAYDGYTLAGADQTGRPWHYGRAFHRYANGVQLQYKGVLGKGSGSLSIDGIIFDATAGESTFKLMDIHLTSSGNYKVRNGATGQILAEAYGLASPIHQANGFAEDFDSTTP